MPKENKKPALTSPYLHIKYHEPWYLDTEIPDLDQHMGNLRRVLRILDKKTNILESYQDERLEQNIQLLLLNEYKELQVQRYPNDVYLGEFILLDDPKDKRRFSLNYLMEGKYPLILGHIPLKHQLQVKNLMASKRNIKLATQIDGGPYKIITYEEGDLKIVEKRRPYSLRVILY